MIIAILTLLVGFVLGFCLGVDMMMAKEVPRPVLVRPTHKQGPGWRGP